MFTVYYVQGYPYKKAAILKEAHKDIPPLYRGHIWAALLEVDGDVDGNYMAVDKETPTHTDRQVIVLQLTIFVKIQVKDSLLNLVSEKWVIAIFFGKQITLLGLVFASAVVHCTHL